MESEREKLLRMEDELKVRTDTGGAKGGKKKKKKETNKKETKKKKRKNGITETRFLVRIFA